MTRTDEILIALAEARKPMSAREVCEVVELEMDAHALARVGAMLKHLGKAGKIVAGEPLRTMGKPIPWTITKLGLEQLKASKLLPDRPVNNGTPKEPDAAAAWIVPRNVAPLSKKKVADPIADKQVFDLDRLDAQPATSPELFQIAVRDDGCVLVIYSDRVVQRIKPEVVDKICEVRQRMTK